MGLFDLESREALIGTPTVTVTANASGNVLERLAYIANKIGGGPPGDIVSSLGIPPPSSDPVDRIINENMTFEDAVVHYYRNLTIAPGVTVRLRNGPMIIVVEGDLTVGEGAVIDGDGLGGKGGAAPGPSPGKGGYGGNFWNFGVQRESPAQGDPLVSRQDFGVGFGIYTDGFLVPISYPRLEGIMAFALFGSENTELSGSEYVNGRAWEDFTLWDIDGFDLLFFRAIVYAIFSRTTYSSTYGGLGGGGGGSGAGTYATSSSSISVPAAKCYAGKGHDGDGGGEPGTGGIGFGGGGSGGMNYTSNTTYAGSGGDGGGTQLWVVRRINNAGIIRSNGTPGNAAGGIYGAGGGGGGGGCAALLLYGEPFGAGIGTWQANGGQGGAAGTYGRRGGDGGAGLVKTVHLLL